MENWGLIFFSLFPKNSHLFQKGLGGTAVTPALLRGSDSARSRAPGASGSVHLGVLGCVGAVLWSGLESQQEFPRRLSVCVFMDRFWGLRCGSRSRRQWEHLANGPVHFQPIPDLRSTNDAGLNL